MKRNLRKGTTAVLLEVPTELYQRYLETLKRRGLKRRYHSTLLFITALEKEIELYESSSLGKIKRGS